MDIMKALSTVGNVAIDAASEAANFVTNHTPGVNVSKGVDSYVYLSGDSYSVKIEARDYDIPPLTEQRDPLVGKMQHCSCEIASKHLSLGEASSGYTIRARKNGADVLSRHAEIRPGDGNIQKSEYLDDMLKTQSIISNGTAVSYGFYDAGVNAKHESYMYVTDDYSNWMANCLADKPALRNKPFNTFVLPGSHDAGMFCGVDSDEAARDLLHRLVAKFASQEALATALAGGAAVGVATSAIAVPAMVLAGLLIVAAEGSSAPRRFLISLGYTQKDTISTQLALGTRYFDFRPGYAFDRPGQAPLRHQHNFIPGCEFEKFLKDIADFLSGHKEEIVVVQINYSGFMNDEMKPASATIDDLIAQVLAGTGLQRGGVADLQATVGELITAGKRLIILKHDDTKQDSYSDGAYATDNPENIVKQLESTLDNLASTQDAHWTVLQLQGTYPNKLFNEAKQWNPLGLMKTLASRSDAASLLLSTKARFDHATYQWLMKEKEGKTVAGRCGSKLLVLLNDFVDNALTSHAWAMTKQRCDRK